MAALGVGCVFVLGMLFMLLAGDNKPDTVTADTNSTALVPDVENPTGGKVK